MSLRTAIARSVRPALRSNLRSTVVRQLPRRNYMVGLQPGVEEQHLVQEAATAVDMVASYFGLMGVSCAVGSLGGAVLANKENAAARKELREQYAMDIREQMIRDSIV